MLSQAESHAKRAVIEAVVIRADGTREHIGVISYWHKNPLMRVIGKLYVKLNMAWWKAKRFVRSQVNGRSSSE